jgi:predicted nicotinamide N-methyase
MRHRDFAFGEHTLSLWTACDLDPLLDSMMQKPDTDPDISDERMPYWAELWPSSLLMAEVMTRHFPSLPDGPFLEMGCGPALPSTLAAVLGRQGIATDYVQEARWLAELNLSTNRVSQQVRVQHLDWREPWEETFPWILAGDIAYETRNFEPILTCWDRMLAQGGQIWLAEPGRSIAKRFFADLEEAGWKREPIGNKERVTVYRITRG